MLHRLTGLAIVLLLAWALTAQPNPSAQEREVIEWVIHSLIQEQQYVWRDWSGAGDRRVVLIADRTIPFPTFADDDYGLNYAAEKLKTEQANLYAQLRSASIIDLGTWTPASPNRCGQDDELYPTLRVVQARMLSPVFSGKPLGVTAALAIRLSTPVFSGDGRTAAVYVEAVGSHVDNSERQLISLKRKNDGPAEWDALIQSDRLFPPAKATAQERQISSVDRAVMTAALQWLVTKQGEFDLVGLADFSPSPAEWNLRQRESNSSFDIPESTLAQLARRNGESFDFDPSIFSIKGVRNLPTGDHRIWSRPSVLVSLPAYDGSNVAILSMTYRTSSDIPETANYLLILRRSNGEWMVVSMTVQDGVIVS